MLRVETREEESFWVVVDEAGQEVAVIAGYLRYVATRGFSRHTVRAYAYDIPIGGGTSGSIGTVIKGSK